MSRIGNRIINIPSGVEVNINDNKINVKGPKGQLDFDFEKEYVDVKVKDNTVIVERYNDEKYSRQIHGTTNSLINNMIIGVSEGFKVELEISGVGYRFNIQGNKIVVSAGYSHVINVEVPQGITVEMPPKSTTELIISGIDKQAVAEFAANIRKIRKPEPYKGKGIKYKEERIRRKEGKKAV